MVFINVYAFFRPFFLYGFDLITAISRLAMITTIISHIIIFDKLSKTIMGSKIWLISSRKIPKICKCPFNV